MSSNIESLKTRLRELELALAEVKARIEEHESREGLSSLASLFGAWEGQLAADDSDFEAVEFSSRWLVDQE